MSAVDQERQRHVVEDLAGIAAIGLKQEPVGVLGAADAGAVVEDPFGAVIVLVHLRVSGQRLCVAQVVAGAIAVGVLADGV